MLTNRKQRFFFCFQKGDNALTTSMSIHMLELTKGGCGIRSQIKCSGGTFVGMVTHSVASSITCPTSSPGEILIGLTVDRLELAVGVDRFDKEFDSPHVATRHTVCNF
jgi:hypothetical protein